jgi:hypothetical protein
MVGVRERADGRTPSEQVIQVHDRCLRMPLSEAGPEWSRAAPAIERAVADGIEAAEILAPSYEDEDRLAAVRALVEGLERRGVLAIVRWQGVGSDG